MSVARVPPARPGGRHLLRSSALATAIVADAGIRPGDLVLDIGAGSGMLTRALLAAQARVIAIEPDRRLGARLRGSGARVIAADARAWPLPDEPFKVVANLPFVHAAEICRRLFDPAVPLVSADLIVEWDFAAKRARLWPSTAQTVIWSAWHELTVTRRIEPPAFVPRPSVAAAVLRARRRSRPLVRPADSAPYEQFVRRGFRLGRTARERDPHAWAHAFATSGRARTLRP
ncbi:MAG TPA: rRNA adenine N-6-methyltransferase family protein [Gaiellaceae bacterium]|nr:rRNA adenine N-6-methyltransferase family protein [Gaiellaceae bacterium]